MYQPYAPPPKSTHEISEFHSNLYQNMTSRGLDFDQWNDGTSTKHDQELTEKIKKRLKSDIGKLSTGMQKKIVRSYALIND